jgi:phospholipase/carboxylesterase
VIEPTLPYLERSPRDTPGDPAPLVILLHGRGAEAKTIFSIQGLLDSRFCVIAITAPYPSSIGGFEWFHSNPRAGDEEIDDAERFDDAEKILTNDITLHIKRLNAEKSPLFLWGFSQGAAMSLIIGLRGEIKVKGIVPMSGFLPSPIRRWKNWNTNVHVLLAHGSRDEVLSPETSRNTQRFLESIGIAAEYQEYNGPHKMSLTSIAYINNWIKQLSGLETE